MAKVHESPNAEWCETSDQAERKRKSVAKKVDTKGKTTAGKGRNTVLS